MPKTDLMTIKLSTHEGHCLLGAIAAANTRESTKSEITRRGWIAERILNALCAAQPELRDAIADVYAKDSGTI